MLQLEVLVLELAAIDRLAASAVAVGEIASLEHEVRDDAMELGATVGELLARLADTLLSSAKRTEVLHSLGNARAEQTHHDAARRLAVNGDIKVDLVGDLGVLLQTSVPRTKEKWKKSNETRSGRADLGKGKCGERDQKQRDNKQLGHLKDVRFACFDVSVFAALVP
jgi:hypothetical protein